MFLTFLLLVFLQLLVRKRVYVVIFPVFQLFLHDLAIPTSVANVVAGIHHPVETGVTASGARPARDLPLQEPILLKVESSDHQQAQD